MVGCLSSLQLQFGSQWAGPTCIRTGVILFWNRIWINLRWLFWASVERILMQNRSGSRHLLLVPLCLCRAAKEEWKSSLWYSYGLSSMAEIVTSWVVVFVIFRVIFFPMSIIHAPESFHVSQEFVWKRCFASRSKLSSEIRSAFLNCTRNRSIPAMSAWNSTTGTCVWWQYLTQ